MPLAITRHYRHFKRYRRIGEVLLHHGFGYLLHETGFLSLLSPFKRLKAMKEESASSYGLGPRLRMVLEELGPTFIKFGQLLSTRPDFIPPKIINELENLQDNVAPVAFAYIKGQIENELGKPITELFLEFENRPLAAASIGQVHRAVLIDGTPVVVKIRRPNVENVIATDLEIMFRLARNIEERLGKGFVDGVELVEYFAKTIRQELDYKREGRNIDRFRHQFLDNSNIIVPEVYWDLSTSKILTMDYVSGIKLKDQHLLFESNIDLNKVANIAIEAFFNQIFKHGFYHGDPHPGNLLVTGEGKLVFLDFGVVGRLDRGTMKSLAKLMVAGVRRDVDLVMEVFRDLEAFREKPSRQMYLAFNNLIDEYYGRTLKELDLPTITEDLLDLVRLYPIKLPSDLTLLVKVLLTIESVGTRLVPDFNIIEALEPFTKAWIKENYNVQQLTELAWEHTRKVTKSLLNFPGQAESVLDLIEAGEMKINFQHQGLEKLINRLDVASNRLTIGLIIGSLILGSSFLLIMEQGPKFLNVPLIGLLGYLLAAVIGVGLLISILRSGRF